MLEPKAENQGAPPVVPPPWANGESSLPASMPPPMAQACGSTTPHLPPPRQRGPLAGIIKTVVVLVVAVLFVRTFLAESYNVPTGSMGPTLRGRHKAVRCPCCGAEVVVGRASAIAPDGEPEASAIAEKVYNEADCPYCGCDKLDLKAVPETPGDSVIVHEHLYDFRAPQRWEMIVFNNPHAQRSARRMDTFVKRLIGLPGESVLIRDGDIVINGTVVGKTWKQLRSMQVLVYDNQFLPQDAPTPFRWQSEMPGYFVPEADGREFRLARPSPKAEAEPPKPPGYHWLQYVHRVRDPRDPTKWHSRPITNRLGYNGKEEYGLSPVHDFILECEVEASGSGWLGLAITDGWDNVLVEVPVGDAGEAARVLLETKPLAGKPQERPWTPLAAPPLRLRADQRHRIELALVDRRIMLAVDGKEIVAGIELPTDPTRLGDPPLEPRPVDRAFAWGGRGPVAVGGRELGLHVSVLRLYRDIHYSDPGRDPGQGRNGLDRPCLLGPGEHFVLGDNSTKSYDSRSWQDPAIRYPWLVGKACFRHLPLRPLDTPWFGRRHGPDWSRIGILR